MPDTNHPEIRRANVRQLAYRIKGYGDNPSVRFSFLLGAGASIESGIPLAGAMINDFRQRIIEDQSPEDCTDPKEQQAWIESQDWYKTSAAAGTLYSDLFEMQEPKERGRQRYIEEMIEGKKPSFGYVVLANLMARNYLNTVLTTNFDDLVYNACSIFTDIRPVVYAYGTMVSDLRITNARPKILKLHGDYLYSKLKNSEGELAFQDPNMSRYVSMLLNEYGLIVVGYSGCDKSVMDMLRKFPPDNDLYWCGRANSPIPESVRSLLIEKRGYYVEIDSFDQMMNEIRSVIKFDVPKMLGSLETRQEQIIEQLKRFPQRTVSGMVSLLREIYDFRQGDAAERKNKQLKEEAFLHYLNAWEAWLRGDFPEAEKEFRESVRLNPEDVDGRIQLAGVLSQEGRYDEAAEELKRARPHASGESVLDIEVKSGYLYMLQGQYAEALEHYTEAIQFDSQNAVAQNGLGICLMHLDRQDEAIIALRRATEMDTVSYYAAFNLASMLMVKGDMVQADVWWKTVESRWQFRDRIDPYNQAIMQACLGEDKEAVTTMEEAIANGQPGLASLAAESIQFIERAVACPPVIHTLRQILEKAAKG
jgi:Flp pilus assembly protein TadD/NAD-dependent SIR2 family protein deacetylase